MKTTLTLGFRVLYWSSGSPSDLLLLYNGYYYGKTKVIDTLHLKKTKKVKVAVLLKNTKK